MVQLAKEDAAKRWVKPYDKNVKLKRLVDLDWVDEDKRQELLAKVFGKKTPIAKYFFVDGGALAPDARVIAEDGSVFTPEELYEQYILQIVSDLKMDGGKSK